MQLAYPEPQSNEYGVVTRSSPRELISLDDNITFHATRLLLLIKVSGRPVSNPRIEGRTKLAKMDFFVRYPQFLNKAASKLLSSADYEEVKSQLVVNPTVESHMIRYKYGPWDKKYYLTLAYCQITPVNVPPINGNSVPPINDKDVPSVATTLNC